MAVVQNEMADTSCALVEDDDEIGPLEEGQSDESGGSQDEEDEKPETSKVL